jgi:hypothetical protein
VAPLTRVLDIPTSNLGQDTDCSDLPRTVLSGPKVDSAFNINENQTTFMEIRARPALKADNLTAVCEEIVWPM